jgi:hypothetical protein
MAIGRRLVEVERLFLRTPEQFAQDGDFSPTEYFSRNSGPTQFHFDGGVTQVLDVWGEQLSLVVLPEPLRESEFWSQEGERLYQLSSMDPPPPGLPSCLGKTCSDVRILTLNDPGDWEEAREAGVSYVLRPDLELIYCIYLHGDMDSDYLMLRSDLPRDLVARCYSIARGAYVDPSE